jgi:uridine kinase
MHPCDGPSSPSLPSISAPLTDLAAHLREQPPSCGPVRLVAVDGHAGSGKTTLAGALAEALDDAPVVHLDDLATHESFFGWTVRLHRQVLTPLSQGRTARYPAYDWTRGAFPEPGDPDSGTQIPPEPVVIIEGVGAGRRALRPHLACLVWMDLPAGQAWQRGRRRDGPRLEEFWKAWTRAETDHFADDPSYSYANFVVHPGERGFEVRKGLKRRP